MGAYSEDQPVLPRHGDSSPPEEAKSNTWWRYVVGCCLVVGIPLVLTTIVSYVSESTTPPEYSVVIAAVTGLDPVTDLQGRVALDPVFNLTVGIASASSLYGACIEPGTAIKVSYSYVRLPLAGGRAPDMCVEPLQSSEKLPVVARGFGVDVPGFLLDSLAEDMRRGEAVFEVKLTGLEDGKQWKVVTCWARVGDAVAAVKDPCTVHYVDTDSMPEPLQPVVQGDALAARSPAPGVRH